MAPRIPSRSPIHSPAQGEFDAHAIERLAGTTLQASFPVPASGDHTQLPNPSGRRLPPAARRTMRARAHRALPAEREMQLPGTAEALKFSVPPFFARTSAQEHALLRQVLLAPPPPPQDIRTRSTPDGRLALAYLAEVRTEDDRTRKVLVALDIGPPPGRALRNAQILEAQARGPGIQLVRARPTFPHLEGLHVDMLDLVMAELHSPRDLGALASVSAGMLDKVGVQAMVARALQSLVDEAIEYRDTSYGAYHTCLNQLARNGRFEAFFRESYYEHGRAFGGIRDSRLAPHEQKKMLEMLAENIHELTPPSEGWKGVALARAAILHAHAQLPAHARIDLHNPRLPADYQTPLYRLHHGSAFASAEQAVQAGVPVPMAIETFEVTEAACQEALQRLAKAPAEVMVMTGTPPLDALAAMGVEDPQLRDEMQGDLQSAIARTLAAAACLCVDTFREDEAIRKYYGVTGQAHRQTLDDTRASLNQDRQVVLQALAPGGRIDDEALDGDDDHQRQLLIEYACLLRKAPALFEAGKSVMEVVDGIGVMHPLSCHLARRLKENPDISWFGRKDPDLAPALEAPPPEPPPGPGDETGGA